MFRIVFLSNFTGECCINLTQFNLFTSNNIFINGTNFENGRTSITTIGDINIDTGKKLCIGQTCIDESQLIKFNASVSPISIITRTNFEIGTIQNQISFITAGDLVSIEISGTLSRINYTKPSTNIPENFQIILKTNDEVTIGSFIINRTTMTANNPIGFTGYFSGDVVIPSNTIIYLSQPLRVTTNTKFYLSAPPSNGFTFKDITFKISTNPRN